MTKENMRVKTLLEPPEALLQELLREVRSSRKYRDLDIPEETLRDLLTQALERQPNSKAALKVVREKLHNIVAPYLGDPDYPQASRDMAAAFASKQSESVRAACLKLLQAHASTRERIPLLDSFYPRLWEVTELPSSLLDLACGLHPFSLPWMGLSKESQYYAYDIHAPRIALINEFFQLAAQTGAAFNQDILVQPPQLQADVALFLKEPYRFEKRQRGCNLPFWQALQVRWLIISLPTASLRGSRDILERQRRMIYNILRETDWPVTEIPFDNELVFCIRKDG
jgi:16S rRNA (guanine(1405)-N(7))-methyltransferase